jgi:thioredoxin-related protein
MKKFFLLAGLIGFVSLACAQQPAAPVAAPAAESAPDIWMTDFKAASEKALAESKYLLMDFTGSDWCGWCIRLDKEVFSQKEFKDFAADKLVLLKLDFPRRKTLPDETKKQNAELAQKYRVQGYPTILILSPAGNLVKQTGYLEGGAAAYVEHLKGILAAEKK